MLGPVDLWCTNLDPFGQRLCAIYTALNVLDLEPLNRQTFALSRWHTDRCKNVQQRSTMEWSPPSNGIAMCQTWN